VPRIDEQDIGLDDGDVAHDAIGRRVEQVAEPARADVVKEDHEEVGLDALVPRAGRGCHRQLTLVDLVPVPVVRQRGVVRVGEDHTRHASAPLARSLAPGSGRVDDAGRAGTLGRAGESVNVSKSIRPSAGAPSLSGPGIAGSGAGVQGIDDSREAPMTLRDRLDAMRAQAKTRIPAEAAAVMERATEDLRRSGIMAGVPKVGERALGFTLPDSL
jgi:hypothetical protein